MLNNKTVLITGGTGSFGKMFTKFVLEKYQPKKLVILSRDELKQYEMGELYPKEQFPNIRFFIGDVRDKQRLYRAFDGVDIVVHAAALKQVPAAEYNPMEAIKTNINGAANIIDAAIDCNVNKVIALSTDKAVNPINLYGATKLCSDKLFIAANAYSGLNKTIFSVVRYGNVMGSRGSVIPLFLKMRGSGKLPITDRRMTRFLITLEQGVQFVLNCVDVMKGGEIFIPKSPSIKIMDLAKSIGPGCKHDFVGIRPGEKLHEVLVPEDDAHRTIEFEKFFIIQPGHDFWNLEKTLHTDGVPCPNYFKYSSDMNSDWLSAEELMTMIDEMGI